MTTVRRGAATSKAAFTRAFEVESGKWGVHTPIPPKSAKSFSPKVLSAKGEEGGTPKSAKKSYFGEEKKVSVSLPDAEQFNVPKMSLLLRNR